MDSPITPDRLPLQVDDHGSVRVGQTRVTLDFIVEALQSGSPPESAARFPTLELPDVYAALWYYLRHQAEVDAYLAERDRQADALRAEIETRWPPEELRRRLLSRQARQKV